MLITVATVCLNAEDCIARTIRSVLVQRNVEIEYLIKEGESRDHTGRVIAEETRVIREGGIRFRHIRRADQGIYEAMNQAVAEASGEFILFLNAGDELADESVLARILSYAEARKADVIYGDAVVRDEGGDGVWHGDLSLIRRKMPFCHQACLTRRSRLEQLQFNEGYRIAGDYDMTLRLYQQPASFYYVRERIAVYYLDGISSCCYRERLKELNRVRVKYGYGMGKPEYCLKYLEASVKETVDRAFPVLIKRSLREFYKKYVKKYGSVVQR